MLKDIYSPLEIDEQWDQRAPMAEGDSSMGAMGLMGEKQSAAADGGGATAVLEAPPAAPVPAETIAATSDAVAPEAYVSPAAEATEPASPAADDSSETMPDPMAATTETTEDSSSETDTSSDDKAAAMLGGASQTDTDKDATPDPLAQSDASGDVASTEGSESPADGIKQITQPVVEYKPDPGNELKQPTGELETAELTSDATKDADDASEQAEPEITNDHAGAESTESADEDSLAKIASSENEEETKPAITLDSDSSEAVNADIGTGENQAQDSIDSIDKGVEEILNKAKADLAHIEAQIADMRVEIDGKEKNLADLEKAKARIDEMLVLLGQVKASSN